MTRRKPIGRVPKGVKGGYQDGDYARLADAIMSVPSRATTEPMQPITLYPVSPDCNVAVWVEHYREGFPAPDYRVEALGTHIVVIKLKGMSTTLRKQVAALLLE